MLLFDYSELAGKIKSRFGNQGNFAKAIKISEHSLSQKMNNKRAWKQPEIIRACDALGIVAEEISAYFFTLKVQ